MHETEAGGAPTYAVVSVDRWTRRWLVFSGVALLVVAALPWYDVERADTRSVIREAESPWRPPWDLHQPSWWWQPGEPFPPALVAFHVVTPLLGVFALFLARARRCSTWLLLAFAVAIFGSESLVAWTTNSGDWLWRLSGTLIAPGVALVAAGNHLRRLYPLAARPRWVAFSGGATLMVGVALIAFDWTRQEGQAPPTTYLNLALLGAFALLGLASLRTSVVSVRATSTLLRVVVAATVFWLWWNARAGWPYDTWRILPWQRIVVDGVVGSLEYVASLVASAVGLAAWLEPQVRRDRARASALATA